MNPPGNLDLKNSDGQRNTEKNSLVRVNSSANELCESGPAEESSPVTSDTLGPQAGLDQNNFLRRVMVPSVVGIENCFLWTQDDFYSAQINELILEIQASNRWGTLSSSFRELILASTRPRFDFRKTLRQFRASVLTSQRQLTRMKPNRRYGLEYLGCRRKFSTRLLFAIDVSGSIGSHDLENGLSILNRFFQYGIEQVDVLLFDSEIRTPEPVRFKKARSGIEVVGRGGTDFQPIMDFIEQNQEYDGLIIFTDGVAPHPRIPTRNRQTRLCWLFNSEENFQKFGGACSGRIFKTFIRSSESV